MTDVTFIGLQKADLFNLRLVIKLQGNCCLRYYQYMDQEWDWQSVADWVVQGCWEQITGPKPQTEAWLQKSNKRPDGLSWEDVLEAVELLEYNRWIDFKGHNLALSRESISSVNYISFTGKATRNINGQIEDNPDLPIKFTG